MKIDKNVTLEEVLKMEKPADDFIVKLEDNKPGVRFNGFKLRDLETSEIYHEYYPENIYELDYFADHELEYIFPNKLLRTQRTLGTTLNLCVGDQKVKNLTLVERHYIEGKTLAANYSFTFPTFFPNSQNTVEFIYNVPKLDKETYDKMDRGEDVHVRSDTFVFVEGKVCVHRRAKYIYCDEKTISK